jgi:hypothetical protein
VKIIQDPKWVYTMQVDPPVIPTEPPRYDEQISALEDKIAKLTEALAAVDAKFTKLRAVGKTGSRAYHDHSADLEVKVVE